MRNRYIFHLNKVVYNLNVRCVLCSDRHRGGSQEQESGKSQAHPFTRFPQANPFSRVSQANPFSRASAFPEANPLSRKLSRSGGSVSKVAQTSEFPSPLEFSMSLILLARRDTVCTPRVVDLSECAGHSCQLARPTDSVHHGRQATIVPN